MATCKFKIGDKIIGNSDRYAFTCKGWKGIVTRVYADRFEARGDGNEDHNGLFTNLKFDYFDLRETAEKIVITHDGKTTTATLYRGDGSKEQATAKCAPEDTFDFNVGAKLAMDRLMEKVNTGEWRVVKRKPRVGDYVRLKTNGMYPWNTPGDILKVDAVKYGDLVYVYGKNHIRDTDDDGYPWCYSANEYEVVENVTNAELPKYYNGKVVCISNEVLGKLSVGGFTVGKIYEVKDGIVIKNGGNGCYKRYTSVEALSNGLGNQFIPLVE